MPKSKGKAFVLYLFLALCSIVSSGAVRATSLTQPSEVKERVLREARDLIEQDEPTHTREALALLSRYENRYQEDPKFLLFLAEAHYKMADPSGDIDKEFPVYQKVGEYAEKALKLDPQHTEGHYWYGLFLLRKAQLTGGIRAFFYVRRGMKELETVRTTRVNYDHAGASRVLALLYRLAPGWTPFGDIDKSIRLAQEAVRVDPGFPLNHLYLAESYHKRGDNGPAVAEYRRVIALAAPSKGEREHAQEMLMKLTPSSSH